MAKTKLERRVKIKVRIRSKISGTTQIPRLSVFRSNKQISAQVIDDINKKTLVAASSLIKEISEQKVNKTESAKLVGKLLAKRSKDAGISTVVFDRNGYLYHGRVKALADAAREEGLKF